MIQFKVFFLKEDWEANLKKISSKEFLWFFITEKKKQAKLS